MQQASWSGREQLSVGQVALPKLIPKPLAKDDLLVKVMAVSIHAAASTPQIAWPSTVSPSGARHLIRVDALAIR